MTTKKLIEDVCALQAAWIAWRVAGMEGFEPLTTEQLDCRIDLMTKVISRLKRQVRKR